MTLPRDFNPFANQPIHVPKAYHEDLNLYSTTFISGDSKTTNLEEAPFKRYVDFWLLAVVVGASQGHFMPMTTGDRQRFITGSVFQRDLATIEFLLLLAIAHTEDPFVVNDARQVMDIAEGYAASGIPLVKEMMHQGHLPPLQNLTRSLLRALAPNEGGQEIDTVDA